MRSTRLPLAVMSRNSVRRRTLPSLGAASKLAFALASSSTMCLRKVDVGAPLKSVCLGQGIAAETGLRVGRFPKEHSVICGSWVDRTPNGFPGLGFSRFVRTGFARHRWTDPIRTPLGAGSSSAASKSRDRTRRRILRQSRRDDSELKCRYRIIVHNTEASRRHAALRSP